MSLFHRQKKIKVKEQDSEVPIIKVDSIYRGLDYLVEFIKQIRPSSKGNIA